ncbi:MAG: tubulin-like doman-containing protein [Thermosynechococcaceae cyanobacterium MS004]|nr:tubulin-like doman-containing protein [Thermosynechococcaceae cyanobacterium MS004]
MSLYIVSIGGTGAKCVESIIHLAAAGLFGNEKIQILFIDPDESNGNLTRTRETLTTYQACRRAVVESGAAAASWMQPSIEALEVWSPFSGSINKSLGAYFNYESYAFNSPGLGHLFDVLYTPGEREAELDVGFRGRPAIGSAIMSQVKLDNTSQEPWRSLLQRIELDLGVGGGTPRIFICGSIFGGTGASGFPTIGRLLKNKLERSGMSSVKIGGLLMLPYFQFSVPADQDPGAIYARPEQFLLNTEAALRYYQAQPIFDSIYLLGDQEPASVPQFSVGKNTQKNDPHFIELYAALAARHFISQQELQPVVLLSRQSDQRVTWDDIPDKAVVKPSLANAVRFAYLWAANLSPELKDGKGNIKNFQKAAPWFTRFFKPQVLFNRSALPDLNDELQQDILQCIDSWALSFLRWVSLIHGTGGTSRSIQLFRHSFLLNGNGEVPKVTENFPKLVLGADNLEQSKDVTPQAIKEKLMSVSPDPAPGVAGLATALYSLCKP